MSSELLHSYHAKRNPDASPEPYGFAGRGTGRLFVVQHHYARREHYDLRLEMDGVLRSWAVPKGPSPNPADKRLAVETEPHPLAYASFEGVIPDGNYGAGTMIVWDRGTFNALEDMEEGYTRGKLLFELHGHKLKGRWTLVRTKQNWLLIKEYDSHTEDASTEHYPADSVFSGLLSPELREPQTKQKKLARKLKRLGAKTGDVDGARIKPMLATAGKAFSHKDWLFELKYDGYRLTACRTERGVKVISRSRLDFSATFPDVIFALEHLPFDRFVLDGEVVCHDTQGLPSFSLLQSRGRATNPFDVRRGALAAPATFYAFDLISVEGYDLRSLPLIKRKELLQFMLPSTGPIRYSEHVAEHGAELYDNIIAMGLEGVVAKRGASIYQNGRSRDWIKCTGIKEDDFVVIGWVPGRSRERPFSALALGYYYAGHLTFVGRVGSGFGDADLEAGARRLGELEDSAPPDDPPNDADYRWVQPKFVCTVRFKQHTEAGRLRAPVFVGWRDDKPPGECSDGLGAAATTTENVANLTNPDKVLWPEDNYTKRDLVDYYRTIAPHMLPYLADRPLVMTRYPDGIDGKRFFQKNAPMGTPEWIDSVALYSDSGGREISYLLLDSEEALAHVGNLGAVSLHVWASRVAHLSQPDWCVIDLDPKEAPFKHVVAIARVIKELCDDIDLPVFLKTSGKTGLHVMLPLAAQLTHEQSRHLAHVIAMVTADQVPEIGTLERSLANRDGKVYIDYGQNGHGRTIAAPFSVRAVRGASVSMPLRWEELTPGKSNDKFTITNAPRRLAQLKHDPLVDILSVRIDAETIVTALESLARRVAD